MSVSTGRATAVSEPRTGATATTKLRPPSPPASLLRRERLIALLDEALERRLTTVVADAGLGKSTLLAAWASGVNCAWYTASPDDASLAAFARGLVDALRLRVPALRAEVAGAVTATTGPGAEQDDAARARGFAALVCETLQSELRRDLVLVLDDVQEVLRSPGATQVIESLCRQAPERLHVVLASRAELPFPIERLRGQGQVLEITGSQLAFDADETAALLIALLGADDAGVAVELHRVTGGWPAAVRLAVETLRGVAPPDRRTALERMRRPGGPLLAYLAAEVFSHEPPQVAELVRRVAPLERFSAELCEALGVPSAAELLDALARRGLFVELQGHTAGWYSLGAPVREFALAHLAPSDEEMRTVRTTASRWFEEHQEPEDALRCLSPTADAAETAALLAAHGGTLLARGAVDPVLEALAQLPSGLRSPAIEALAGEAFQIRGDWDEALRCFERAAEHAETLPPGLAWRMGLLLHLGGRLDEAVDTYDRADEDGESRDVALLLAWRASAHWLRADAEACRADAKRAFNVASAANDPQALAAAHTVLAMLAALEGDRGANDAHYLRALDYAEQAGDVLQLIRVRTNRGSRHVEECSYEEAISELDLALRLAELAGFAAFRALALTNRGEALAKLGRFEEAIADLEASRELYQRLGSRMVAYPLEKLGEVYRVRGEWTLARAAFEEALIQSEASGDLQGLVPSLSGLARTLVADEPDEAERLAARALSLGPGMNHAHALLAAGWVALACGDRDRATQNATDAAADAGVRRDRASLAESLELRALAGRDRARDVERLSEAADIWRELGNPAGEARAELETALLTGDADGAARAEASLVAIGARGYRASLALVMPVDRAPAVVVQSLGRFRVFQGGEPVAIGAWQSRKARDLLKMLVARRGRPDAARRPHGGSLAGAEPGAARKPAVRPAQHRPWRAGSRPPVRAGALRRCRQARGLAPDREPRARRRGLPLRRARRARAVQKRRPEAQRSTRRGRGRRMRGLPGGGRLRGLGDRAPRGDPRDVHAGRPRARRGGRARGDADATTRYYLRVLERDPYDEPAHLGLVAALEAAGRHGEARRCFRAYCARMDEIGIESAPFPAGRTLTAP